MPLSPLFTTGERDPVTPGAEDSPYAKPDSGARWLAPTAQCTHSTGGVNPQMHAAESARVFRDVIDSPEAGSLEEQAALEEIDARRHEEMYPQSRKARRRAARKHWSDRAHALGR